MKDKKPEGRKALKQAGAVRKKDALVRSNRALAARGKPGKIGKPFKLGEDPRRHKLGRVSLDRAAAAAKINNLLCNGTGDPAELAAVLWKHALKGEAWAVSELLDRICGKVALAIQLEKPIVQGFVVCHQDEEPTPADYARLDAKIKKETDNEPALSPIDEKAERLLAMSPKIGGRDER